MEDFTFSKEGAERLAATAGGLVRSNHLSLAEFGVLLHELMNEEMESFDYSEYMNETPFEWSSLSFQYSA